MNGKNRRPTKNEKKRAKKAAAKKAAAEAVKTNGEKDAGPSAMDEDAPPPPPPEEVVVEYVSADINDEPSMAEFKAIFEKFSSAEELTGKKKITSDPVEAAKAAAAAVEAAAAAAGLAAKEEDDENGEKKLSRKQRKMKSRLSVAELKQLVQRPDVVEAHDVTAADPRLLVFLKSYRNTVPVPRHWCHKRKYLQGKRGIEKTPFELPEFIAHTGIEKIRSAIMEQEEAQKAKQKQRARVQPKAGRIDIDYQVLHDAFFKYQKKPQLSMHGDIYYEGKEFEVKLKEKKPGVVSESLKQALGMPENAPPPWLINMQRYGPPPSYPNLKIAGLNAPIPEGASFGYHAAGWGKPPVDEYGRPIYGDVFGVAEAQGVGTAAEVDRTLWGELGEEEEESEEEEDDDDEEEDEEEDMSGMETPSTEAGISSITSGLETPESIDLRKRAGTDTPDTSGIDSAPKELYQVVQERAARVGSGIFGTDKKYVVGGGAGEVQASLDPSQLEDQVSDQQFLSHTYGAQESDGTDSALMEDARKRKRKAEKDKEKESKKGKYGDFKF